MRETKTGKLLFIGVSFKLKQFLDIFKINVFIKATKNGYIEILELLIENKADLNITNKDGETPLIIGIY